MRGDLGWGRQLPGLALEFVRPTPQHPAERRIEADQSAIDGDKADPDARRFERRAQQVINFVHDSQFTGLSVRRK